MGLAHKLESPERPINERVSWEPVKRNIIISRKQIRKKESNWNLKIKNVNSQIGSSKFIETLKLEDLKELGSMQQKEEFQQTQNYKFSTLLPGKTYNISVYSQRREFLFE